MFISYILFAFSIFDTIYCMSLGNNGDLLDSGESVSREVGINIVNEYLSTGDNHLMQLDEEKYEINYKEQFMNIFSVITKGKRLIKPKHVTCDFVMETQNLLALMFTINPASYDFNDRITVNQIKDIHDNIAYIEVSDQNITKKNKYWLLKMMGFSLDKSVQSYIHYKLVYIHMLRRELINKQRIPTLEMVSRTIKEVRSAIEAQYATIELVENNDLQKLIDMVKKDSGVTVMDTKDDVSYIQEGGMSIIKGIAFTTICFAANLTFCTMALGSLLTVEVVIWLSILSRTLAMDW